MVHILSGLDLAWYQANAHSNTLILVQFWHVLWHVLQNQYGIYQYTATQN